MPQTSEVIEPSHLSPNTTHFTEVKNSLHGSDTSLFDKMHTEEASGSAPSTSKQDSKTPEKTAVNLVLKSPQKGNTIF